MVKHTHNFQFLERFKIDTQDNKKVNVKDTYYDECACNTENDRYREFFVFVCFCGQMSVVARKLEQPL
ncbi:MAG: hypothetical protein AABY22_20020 [Nanoarchaeota archaeon]